MPIISIIVPVYNVENYLEKCVTSILRQTFSDFELILVDDGSTDSSGGLCERLKERDSRIIVIHKENGGLSSARNAGIDIAKGSYLGFVDSDDFISTDMYEELLQAIEEYDADLAICDLVNCYGKIPDIQRIRTKTEVLTQKECFYEVFVGSKISVSAVNKLYRRDLFRGLRYREGITFEDAYIISDILHKCNKIVLNKTGKYFYIHRRNTITTLPYRELDQWAIKAWDKNYEIIKKVYPELEPVGKLRAVWARFVVLDKLFVSDKKKYQSERAKIIQYIRSNLFFIISNQYFTKGRKIAVLFLCIHPSLYNLLLFFENKKRKRLFD